MKIAFVTPEFVTEKENFDGGLANYLNRVSKSLKQLDHEPVIIVSSKESTDITSHEGIEVHRVKTDKGIVYKLEKLMMGKKKSLPLVWKYQSKALNKYLISLNKEKYFNVVQYASYAATGLYRVKEIPAVVRISSYEPMMKEYSLDSEISSVDLLKQSFEKEAILKADKVFAPSELLAKEVSEKLRVTKVSTLRNPFVLDKVMTQYDYSEYEARLKGKKYLLYFGSIRYLKGMETIREIIYPLLKRFSNLYFTFVGKDNWNYIKKIKISARQYDKRIIYINKIPHQKLYPIIANAKAVVLPSRIDNLPNTCLESMALEKSVVGTYGASFDEIIEHKQNGFLVERDNSKELLKILSDLVVMPDEQLKRIEQNAKETIDQYSPENLVPDLVEYYKQAISDYHYH